MRSAAPIVIAESATLNAGQCQPAACKSRKSTTWPKRRRSTRLPSAPPRISESPAHSMRRSGERTSSTDTTSAAPSAKAASTGVCQPASAARKLNVAPLLNTSTRLKNPVSSTRSPGAKRASTSHFVSWSASTIAAAPANQCADLDMAARLVRAAQVRATARAQALFVDIRGVMPAAVAFRVAAGPDFNGKFADFGSSGRGDEEEFKLVAEACQPLMVLPVRSQGDLGLQRCTHLALGAQLLDPFADRLAQLAQALPLRQQGRRVRRRRQLVQGVEEHAVVAFPAEDLPELFGGQRAAL